MAKPDLAKEYVNALIENRLLDAEGWATLLDEATEQERQARESVSMREAALWYAGQGIPVFPCEPQGKRPVIEHGFKDATTDPYTIDYYWGRVQYSKLVEADSGRVQYNIGTPTGIGFDVFDVDGVEGIAAMFGERVNQPAEQHVELAAPFDKLDVRGIVLTPREAGIHIYVPPTGKGNRARLQPGVDYRGAGGYVIVPPSIGANGRRYVWTRPLKSA